LGRFERWGTDSSILLYERRQKRWGEDYRTRHRKTRLGGETKSRLWGGFGGTKGSAGWMAVHQLKAGVSRTRSREGKGSSERTEKFLEEIQNCTIDRSKYHDSAQVKKREWGAVGNNPSAGGEKNSGDHGVRDGK